MTVTMAYRKAVQRGLLQRTERGQYELTQEGKAEQHSAPDGCRIDYLQDGELVGFALAGSCAANGGELYRSLYG